MVLLKETLSVLLAIIGVCLLIIALSFAGLGLYKLFAPKWQEAHREVWEQTPSRIHGATQDISKRYQEYQATNDPIQQQAICQSLRQRYSNLDPSSINDRTLQNFFATCKYGG